MKPVEEPKPMVIPDEAKAMASQIIGEAIKLIPTAPPTAGGLGPSNAAVLAKLETIEKNLYVVFCITEKILGQLVDPSVMQRMGLEVDKKVLKKRGEKK